MNEYNTKPVSGTRDFLATDVRSREKAFALIKTIFESFGFEPLETPAFERIEILTGKYGDESERLIFKILKRGQKEKTGEVDLALRYDLTVPMARVIAEYADNLPKIYKRYQIQPVWRADRPGEGRYREFYQCDIDIAGTDSLMADSEIIIVLIKVLEKLDINEFTVKLNSRKILAGLMDTLNIPKNLEDSVLVSIDKLDKMGLEWVTEELKNKGVSYEIAQELLRQSKDSITKTLGTSQKGLEGLSEVQEIQELIDDKRVVFDPFLARGLSYYTGSIFEIISKRAKGSIAGGGRYDNLLKMFSKKDIPACGGSLGIERILLLMKKAEDSLKITQILVTVWDKTFRKSSIALSKELRNKGFIVETYLGNDKLNKQLAYASRKKIPFVLICGPDEKNKSQATIKNMRTEEQQTMKKDDIYVFFKKIRMATI